ncbi:MAG: poly(beta-D-mannuronate) C5 epimerase 1 [Hyperionvirus sp.]|uniref:Poly(Beta-D-mannuronate) C5 epimerase 1 n=1 Tax=Hyperionvirus sp. TaxID=2487770 RepID=A0A3G5A9I5_9VIRU|nr:MAG: poly(beta-D-mannuronate) C5 epimerase 1 [Hyperionvirus sp.]
MKLVTVLIVALCFLVGAAASTFVPIINIGPSKVLYGWGASLEGGTWDAVYDPSLGGDQTQLLQEGLNLVGENGGGIINILPGEYILQGNLELLNNSHLQGSGIDVSVFKLIDNSIDFAYAGFIRVEMGYNIIISNLTLNGNKAGQGVSATNTYGKYGIFTEGCLGVWFDFVRITEMNHYGFDPHGHKTIMFWGQNLTITNCISDNNGWDGFTLDQSLYIVAENNLARDNGRHGYNVVTGSSHVLISNNVAINNGYYYVPGPGGCGIAVQNNFNFNTADVRIESNSFINNAYAGVCLNNVSEVTIEDNEIIGSCICMDILYSFGFTRINNNLCETRVLFRDVGISLLTDVEPVLQTGNAVYYSSVNNVFVQQAVCSSQGIVNGAYHVGFNIPVINNMTFSIGDPSKAKNVIQEALNVASQNGGGIISLDSGTYVMEGPIVIYGGTYLRGSGIDETFLVLAANAPIFGSDGFVQSRFSVGGMISDLTLDGNRNGQCCHPGCEFGRSGLYLEGCTNFLVKNVRATNFQGNGIMLNQMVNVSVIGSEITGNDANGIIANATVYFTSEGNDVESNGYSQNGCGILISNTPKTGSLNVNKLVNNYISNNNIGGICLSNTDGSISQNVLNDSCLCYNFQSVSASTSISENTCVGNIASSGSFALPGSNIYEVGSCSNSSPTTGWICLNGFYSQTGVSTGSVSTGTISTVSVSTGSVSAGSVSTGSLSTGSVSTGSLSTGSVSTGSLSTGSISTGSEATGSVSTGSLSTGSISTGSASTGTATTGSGEKALNTASNTKNSTFVIVIFSVIFFVFTLF